MKNLRPSSARRMALLACIPFALPLSALADSHRVQKWQRGPAAQALLKPWKGCAELMERFVEDNQLDVRVVPGGVEVVNESEGNGRWGLLYREQLRLKRGSCGTSGHSIYGLKEYLDFTVNRISLGGHPQPSLAEVAAHEDAVAPDPDDARFAAARLLVHCAAEDSSCHYAREDEGKRGTLGAPLFPAQPEHPGRPLGSPDALWTPDLVKRAGVKELDPDEDGTRPEAVLTMQLRQPWRLSSKGSYELWETRFRARNGGGMLAVYDKVRDRHRWVFITKGDWQDGEFDPPGIKNISPKCQGHFRIVSFDAKRVLLETYFERDRYLFAIDLQTGTARPVMLPSRDFAFRQAAGGFEMIPVDEEDKPVGKPQQIQLTP